MPVWSAGEKPNRKYYENIQVCQRFRLLGYHQSSNVIRGLKVSPNSSGNSVPFDSMSLPWQYMCGGGVGGYQVLHVKTWGPS